MDAFQRVTEVRPRGLNSALTWADMFPESDDAEAEFIATWEKVRVPAGDDILTLAVALGKERPLHPKNCFSQRYALYVSIAGRLQELRPGNYINLPVERLGKALDVDGRTISNYARLATDGGYISLIAKHHKLSGTAAKYVFHKERFNMETGEEISPEDSSHFHKDYKDSEECKDSEESHDQQENLRTKEETERPEGPSGIAFDLERQRGKARVPESRRINSSERRKELQEQACFLVAKGQQESHDKT